MRNLTESMNTDTCIENIARLLEIKLDEIPHYDTINDVFEQVEIEEVRKIQKYMVNKLIRSKMFEKYRCMNKYYQIVIDGTRLVTFKERHCKHCLKKIHNRGKADETVEYYHYVLEAKLVVGDIVISLDTEFVENEKENVSKQDCEIKQCYEGTLFLNTVCTYIKTIIGKRDKVRGGNKNEYKRSKCRHHTNTY